MLPYSVQRFSISFRSSGFGVDLRLAATITTSGVALSSAFSRRNLGLGILLRMPLPTPPLLAGWEAEFGKASRFAIGPPPGHPSSTCAMKGGASQWVRVPSGEISPAGSNRCRGVKRGLGEHSGRNEGERRSSLDKGDGQADCSVVVRKFALFTLECVSYSAPSKPIRYRLMVRQQAQLWRSGRANTLMTAPDRLEEAALLPWLSRPNP